MNKWHYLQDSKPHGPVCESELVAMLRAGSLPPSILVWRDGLAKWIQAKHFKELDQEERKQERNEKRSSGEAPPKNKRSEPKDERYYARILGLSGTATRDQVKVKYKELVVQCHPDKVNNLHPTIKAAAEAQMKEVNEAYQYFKKKYNFS